MVQKWALQISTPQTIGDTDAGSETSRDEAHDLPEDIAIVVAGLVSSASPHYFPV